MSSKSFNIVINDQIKPFKKTIKVDSDKSISIRSFLVGEISKNISETKNALESEDVRSTIHCLKKLGIKIIKQIPVAKDSICLMWCTYPQLDIGINA